MMCRHDGSCLPIELHPGQHGTHVLKTGPDTALGHSFSLSSLDGECLPIELYQKQHGPHVVKTGPYAALGHSISLSSLDGEITFHLGVSKFMRSLPRMFSDSTVHIF